MDSYTKPKGSFISYMSNLVKQQGGINLAQGIPGFNPPIELLDILERIVKDNVHQYACRRYRIGVDPDLVDLELRTLEKMIDIPGHENPVTAWLERQAAWENALTKATEVINALRHQRYRHSTNACAEAVSYK